MEAELHPFAHFFEVFTGINVAFASSKRFRKTLKNEIFSLSSSITEDINKELRKLRAEAIALRMSKDELPLEVGAQSNSSAQEDIARVSEEFETEHNELHVREKKFRKFSDGCQSMFALGAFLGIVILYLIGVQSTFTDVVGTTSIALLVSYLLLPAMIALAMMNFDKRWLTWNIRPIWLLIIMVAIVTFAFALCKCPPIHVALANSWWARHAIYASAVTVAVPSGLHAIRGFWHRVRYKRALLLIYLEFKMECHCQNTVLAKKSAGSGVTYSDLPKVTKAHRRGMFLRACGIRHPGLPDIETLVGK